MGDSWKCPSCDNKNPVDRIFCICGEDRPKEANPAQKAHGACCISECPMPGTFTASTRGSESGWHCEWHWDYRGDPVHCARITEELRNNPPKISGCKANGEWINNPPAAEWYLRLIKERREEKEKAAAARIEKARIEALEYVDSQTEQ